MGVEVIETITVGSGGSAAIDFTSIPSTYDHIQLITSTRSEDNTVNYSYAFGHMRINNDSGSNYAYTLGYVSSATPNHAHAYNQTVCSYAAAPCNQRTTAGSFSYSELWIPDYTSTSKMKVIYQTLLTTPNDSGSGYGDMDYGASGPYDWVGYGNWIYEPSSNIAINRLTFIGYAPTGGGTSDFAEGSAITLYGWKE